eukprot:c13745_g1_i1.p1 GENE.c13745_g1_i1~~c13745_g1_i1.p1  ORF type:complete len:301 (-),score=45.44 c13745_g1_i1:5-856(-)
MSTKNKITTKTKKETNKNEIVSTKNETDDNDQLDNLSELISDLKITKQSNFWKRLDSNTPRYHFLILNSSLINTQEVLIQNYPNILTLSEQTTAEFCLQTSVLSFHIGSWRDNKKSPKFQANICFEWPKNDSALEKLRAQSKLTRLQMDGYEKTVLKKSEKYFGADKVFLDRTCSPLEMFQDIELVYHPSIAKVFFKGNDKFSLFKAMCDFCGHFKLFSLDKSDWGAHICLRLSENWGCYETNSEFQQYLAYVHVPIQLMFQINPNAEEWFENLEQNTYYPRT